MPSMIEMSSRSSSTSLMILSKSRSIIVLGGGRDGPRPAGPGATRSTQMDSLATELLRLRRLCHRGHKATSENGQYGDAHGLPASASVETRRGLNPHAVTQRAEGVDHDDRLPPEEVLDLVQHLQLL